MCVSVCVHVCVHMSLWVWGLRRNILSKVHCTSSCGKGEPSVPITARSVTSPLSRYSELEQMAALTVVNIKLFKHQ